MFEIRDLRRLVGAQSTPLRIMAYRPRGACAVMQRALLFFVLSFAVVAATLGQPKRSEAYYNTFDWPGQPYLRDAYGNYAYSDLN